MPQATDADRFDQRLAQMDKAMNKMQSIQAELKTGQRWLLWSGGTAVAVLGLVTAVLVAVVVVNLQRGYALTDQLYDVRADAGTLKTTMEFVREDVSEIKTDLKAARVDIESVARAVGADLGSPKTEQKAEAP